MQHRGLDEFYEKRLVSLRGYLAVHDELLCREEEPCVVICRGCNSKNIVGVLVHESIHHALLWLNDDPFQDDTFDDICDAMSQRGFKL